MKTYSLETNTLLVPSIPLSRNVFHCASFRQLPMLNMDYTRSLGSFREGGRKRQLPVIGQTVLNVTMCVPEYASPNMHSNESLYFQSFKRS